MTSDFLVDALDIGMTYLDYTNAPEATAPPTYENNRYYPIAEDIGATAEDIRSLEGKVGFLEKESESRWITTLALKKISAFVKIAASVSFAAFVITVSGNPTIVAITTISMTLLALWNLKKMINTFSCYDLEKAKVRENLRKDFIDKSFSDIVNRLAFKDLVDYDLLNDKANIAGVKDKTYYYATFKAFDREKENLKTSKMVDINKIENIFRKNVEVFSIWYRSALSRLNYSWTVKICREKDKNSFSTPVYMPQYFLETVIHNKYNQLMAPWGSWKKHEYELIEGAYKNALQRLDDKFRLNFSMI